MKLSQMNSDQLMNALADLSVPVGEICEDEAFRQHIEKIDLSGSGLKSIGSAVKNFLPWVLREHKLEVYAIIGVMNNKTVEEIQNQNGMVTLREAKECFDKDLLNFFISAVPTEQEK